MFRTPVIGGKDKIKDEAGAAAAAASAAAAAAAASDVDIQVVTARTFTTLFSQTKLYQRSSQVSLPLSHLNRLHPHDHCWIWR
jgi:hypothetical protein